MRRARLFLPCFIFISLFLITGWSYAGTFTVTNLNDSGDGSLRWAIEQANTNAIPDTIDFDVSGTISPESPLPPITDDETIIDASSRWDGPWPEGLPGITLDGSGAGMAHGFKIDGASNCHFRGFLITDFEDDAIAIRAGSQSNTIGGVGTGYRNVISASAQSGIVISHSSADNNVVSGNYIGTGVTGTEYLGNDNGISIHSGAQSNTIGGATESEMNIISGNRGNGVGIWGFETNDNKVSGNYIGTDFTGTAELRNESSGISIHGGSQSNMVEGNVISGNGWVGVAIGGLGTDNNKVSGNYIGTDVNGTNALEGNQDHGIWIGEGAQLNTIGGATEDERNIISGNQGAGVLLNGIGTDNNVVCGNYIGTDVNGTAPLENSWSGVNIREGAQSNTVGGMTEGARNVISGNDHAGVVFWGFGTNDNVVCGNFIGTDVNGTNALANSWNGVYITTEAQRNIIGGPTPDERNIISGNDSNGVEINCCSDTRDNEVLGNYIGVDVTGVIPLGNSGCGVVIAGGVESNTIEGNVISGNHDNGVGIWDLGTRDNVVIGNYIGTDAGGVDAMGNQGAGVTLGSAESNTIQENLISANDWVGVNIDGPEANDNVVIGNYVGTDFSGTTALGNSGHGVRLANGAQSNIIGGTTDDARNVISGNGSHGISIAHGGTEDNVVSGNYIGTSADGLAAVGNSGNGIRIQEGAQSNVIGGGSPDERNIISGNHWGGITIADWDTNDNEVSGNYIGTDVTGDADLGNSDNGVIIKQGAQGNTIGGETEAERNVISGNNQVGVRIEDSDTNDNAVLGNYIGTNAGGTDPLGNSWEGVSCHDSFAVIQGNTIAYNEVGVGCYGNAYPDLGGGDAITQGLNEIYGNLGHDVHNETDNTIMAEWNWWGAPEQPDPQRFYGYVDYIPWLTCPSGVLLSSAPSELETLTAFRDDVLSQSGTGRWLIDAYYACAPELVQILLRNPDLGIRSTVILKQLTPGIKFLLGDRRNGSDIVITRLLVNRIQALLEDISAEGGDNLADTLSEISKMLDACGGMRISKAASRLLR